MRSHVRFPALMRTSLWWRDLPLVDYLKKWLCTFDSRFFVLFCWYTRPKHMLKLSGILHYYLVFDRYKGQTCFGVLGDLLSKKWICIKCTPCNAAACDTFRFLWVPVRDIRYTSMHRNHNAIHRIDPMFWKVMDSAMYRCIFIKHRINDNQLIA